MSAATLSPSDNVGGTDVSGSLSSAASANFTIEFFANPPATNQGKNFIGSTNVTTNSSGVANFSVSLTATISASSALTATATDANGNTSQFSSPISVASTLDSDGDGIPDNWTIAHFGHAMGQASDKSRATDDADGDGLTNLQEFLAGTDPRIPGSALRITAITRSGPTLTFASVVGKTYRVEMKTDLTQTGWSPVADQILATATSTTITDTGGIAAGRRFYRVALEP